MTRGDAIDRINRLLDDDSPATANTSMRIPAALRDAAALATEALGAAPSTTALTIDALRSALEAIVMQASLDEHYRLHPDSRPSLADLVIAAAEIDGHPLAGRHELLRRAADEVASRHPDAGPDAVLLWAEARTTAA